MKTNPGRRSLPSGLMSATFCIFFASGAAHAVTTVFFNASQTTNLVSSTSYSDTMSSEGYLFTYTRDRLFTGGISTNPPGRYLRVLWPDGLEVQYVSEGQPTKSPQLNIKRIDGEPFSITSLTAKILAMTSGAGADFEIMPLLNGEDGVPDPYTYSATGYYGQTFIYNTPELTGFDEYKIKLYVDFALTVLTVVDASLPQPPDPFLAIAQLGAGSIEITWPAEAVGFALESSTNLPTRVWGPVTNSPFINGGLFTVQMETTEPLSMYRLRK